MSDVNVHEAGGDFLVVIPSPTGWTICWYMPGEDGKTVSLQEALTSAISPQEEGDDDDRDDEGHDAEDAQDEADMKIVRDWCAAHSVSMSIDAQSGEPDHFVWNSREEAQAAADAMMTLVRRKRSAPWADAAIAAGWSPPADWTK